MISQLKSLTTEIGQNKIQEVCCVVKYKGELKLFQSLICLIY